MEMKVEGMVSNIFTSEGRNNMRLIEVILDDKNLNEAVKRVKRNKGVAGVDKMTVYEIDTYFQNNKERIKKEILEKKYRPQPVKRVYIPKSNAKKRPLGIPSVTDRVIQHVFSSPTSIINFTSKNPSYDDTRRSGRDNELQQRAQSDL